jgi:hypothetical protein
MLHRRQFMVLEPANKGDRWTWRHALAWGGGAAARSSCAAASMILSGTLAHQLQSPATMQSIFSHAAIQSIRIQA